MAGVSHEFIPFAKRVFHEVNVDVTGLEDTYGCYQAIERAVGSISHDDMVKIVLEGQVDEVLDLDLDYLNGKLEGCFYLVRIVDRVKVAIDYRKYENDISLKGEFIRTVQALDLDDDQKSRVIMMGLEALVKKEISL